MIASASCLQLLDPEGETEVDPGRSLVVMGVTAAGVHKPAESLSMGMKGKNDLRGLEETVPEETKSWSTTGFHRQAGNKAWGRVLRNAPKQREGISPK